MPDDQLRPLTSEAYDGFTDARTLDAGHFQVESELINYVYFHNSFETANEFTWQPRITVGLLNNVDFFVRPAYTLGSYSVRAPFPPYKYSNGLNEFGNTTTGVKINLWGNDGGTTAFSIRPYLNLPTTQNTGCDDVLGGGDLALLVRLPCEFSVKFDSEFYATEFYSPFNGNNVYAGFDNSISINKSLCSKANAYWYMNTTVTTIANPNWTGYTGFGAEYNFTANLQLFAGIGFGLNMPADVYNPRLGFAWRF